MFRIKERQTIHLISLIDILLTIGAYLIAYFIRSGITETQLPYTQQNTILILLLIPIWYVLLRISNLTNPQRTKAYSVIFMDLIFIISVGSGLLFISIFVFKLEYISRIIIFLFAALDLLFLFVAKVVFYSILKKKRLRGFNQRNILLIADKTSEFFVRQLDYNAQWGYNISGVISEDDSVCELFRGKCPIYPQSTNIAELIDQQPIDEVIFCKNEFKQNELIPLIYTCQQIGVSFSLQSDLQNIILGRGQLNYLGENPFITISNTPTNYLPLVMKNIFDFVFSFFVLLVSSPLILVVSIAIKLDSKGNVFFSQNRVGLRGREFRVYKFRTMTTNAEKQREALKTKNEMSGPVFKIKNDPRLTHLGKILRRTSIDELPQFFNVLRGDMSVVGPRPALRAEVQQYERWQLRRLSMKPGITCIWQVSGRNKIGFEQWMRLDLKYIDTWTLKLDTIILIKTIRAVLSGDGQ